MEKISLMDIVPAEHNPGECMNCESCELICEYGAITINMGGTLT